MGRERGKGRGEEGKGRVGDKGKGKRRGERKIREKENKIFISYV
jgi:hypothetical protein